MTYKIQFKVYGLETIHGFPLKVAITEIDLDDKVQFTKFLHSVNNNALEFYAPYHGDEWKSTGIIGGDNDLRYLSRVYELIRSNDPIVPLIPETHRSDALVVCHDK